jgi:uncharacterized protein YndB with AHSA1/START domain
MSAVIDTEVVIDRPIERVWATMTNWERAGEWMSGVDRVVADGGIVAGTRLTFHARGKDRPSELVAVEPGRAMTLRSVQGGVTADYAYRLDPVDGRRTRARLVAECRTSGLWTLVGPLLRIAIRRTDGGQMADLKAVVESDPA